jgi:hypothetical protein
MLEAPGVDDDSGEDSDSDVEYIAHSDDSGEDSEVVELQILLLLNLSQSFNQETEH